MAGFFKSLIAKFSKPDFDWDELEAALIGGDLGPKLAMQIVEELREQGRKLNGQDIVQVAREHVKKIIPPSLPPSRTRRVGRTRPITSRSPRWQMKPC